ncbi:MerR family DNA-binding transcriptional regulator [Nocardia sp. NEAU-G5]|uniref:MerR family DNA-binding transcriptional regulator n=1 Tax=Nocardia albiluteola TaxID=2842303 RepID=A0ABS6B6G9_9NOCA|nr:MerR family DNA-binding transcriptional regulator [Nocardia albiluteola]MBU3065355.1 MerR family DNA-binding transcriptional regulator [Nocardia albiluteola]
MRIGALSQRTQTSPRLLRYYEEQGLIVPRRSQNGYRLAPSTSPMPHRK